MTVREALSFYANLRLLELSQKERDTRVSDLITELGLEKVSDSIIGYVGADATNSGLARGLSGGERKRLSIGQQLITNPSLLFLDEPTTGLDSFAADSIVSSLARQAHQGRTIIFTIHQPSSDVMLKFDKLMILGHGRLMYFGPSAKAIDYFGNQGFYCPEDENPGDFYLELLHREAKSSPDDEDIVDVGDLLAPAGTNNFSETSKRAEALEKRFKESKYYASIEEEPETTLQSLASFGNKAPPFWIQFVQLMKRNFINAMREPAVFRAVIIQSLLVSLIMGGIYFDIGNDQTGLQDIGGGLFFAAIFIMFMGMLGPFSLFSVERKQFLFQVREGIYGTHSYFLAKVLAEVPKFFVISLVFSTVIYFMFDLTLDVSKFFIFVMFGFLVASAAFGFGSVVTSAFPNPAVALTVFPLLFIPMMIFSGFYLNSDRTPVYFIWVEYISFVKYTYSGLMKNELIGKDYYCTEAQLIANNNACPYSSGDEYLKFRALDVIPLWLDAVILAGFFVVLSGLAWFFFDRMAKNSKK
jgi:ABC-type multidrug transport system ATPase subunit